MNTNQNFKNINESYLFSTVGKKVNDFSAANPEKEIIKLGIGDVTLPLCPAVIDAMHNAVDEMGKRETFKGYGPEQGYDFLRNSVKSYYAKNKVELDTDEIFISDGAKSDLGNILDLFDTNNTVLIPDPVYPAYVDTNIMSGHKIIYINATEENNFLPLPDPSVKCDIIYICSPNNPTGAVYNREQLSVWIKYALDNNAVILFDAAYESFIDDKTLPKSIYEVENAKKCAIEFCSFSKTAGFTGTRCGYTVVPKELIFKDSCLNKMWLRRQTTKFNGVSYIVQKGADAVFSNEGQKQIHENLNYYKQNAKIISNTLDKLNIKYTGGKNSPYIWLKCPNNLNSWDFFDILLTKVGIVGTPGAGFGKNGDNYFRLTSFNTNEKTKEAMERFYQFFK
ncbi:MAG: LL-diaminopimelate aminotransferase [Cyanobacteria bacterium RUI128]|nr:LL-diaminopimelate aminotransferase [Cyanobacteria bacterium RUI128]